MAYPLVLQWQRLSVEPSYWSTRQLLTFHGAKTDFGLTA